MMLNQYSEIYATCENVTSSLYLQVMAKWVDNKNQIMPVERTMVLRLMDRAWQNQIDVMSKLREGIHLRSYAQNNPLQAYVEEGYELFESMMNTISSDVVTFCTNLKIVIKEK